MEDTTEWFKKHWLPTFQNKGMTGLYKGSEDKIDVQAGKKSKID